MVDEAMRAAVLGRLVLPAEFSTFDPARRAQVAADALERMHATPPETIAKPACSHTRPGGGGKPRVMLYSHGIGMGGAERWLVSLAQTLDRSRVDLVGVGLLSTDQADAILLDKLTRVAPLYVGPDGCRRLAEKSDVIVFWARPTPPFPLPRHRIWCSHGSGKWSLPVARGAEAAGYHLAAVSAEAAKVFPTPSKAKIIFNGMDASRLTIEAGREATRRAWGIAPDETLLGYVGRFWSDKHPQGAAEAAQFLGGRFRAACVGCGCPRWTEYLSRFGPRTVMVARQESLGDVFAALDVLVMASEAEGFSLSVTEAWYCGLPVASTAVGAIPELEAAHGPLTWSVEPHANVQLLAEAAMKADRSDPRVARARRLTAREFTSKRMGERWTDHILEVCAG